MQNSMALIPNKVNMPNINNMTMDDLEQLIEYKLVEIFGNPDSGLELKKEFKAKLEERL